MWKFLRQRKADDDAAEPELSPQELWLGRLRDPETREEALATLTFDDNNVRGPNNELINAAIEYTADPDPEVRYAAMQLVSHTLREVEQIRHALMASVVRGMADESPDMREAVSDALDNIDDTPLEYHRDGNLDWEAMGALLERGEVDATFLKTLSELGAIGLLHHLKTDDPELLQLSAELEGFGALSRLPVDQPWAWQVAASVATWAEPFPEDEDPETIWATYAGLLLPGLNAPELRADVLPALASLASTDTLGPLVIANDEAFAALMTVGLSQQPAIMELLDRHRPADWINAIWDYIEGWLAANVPELYKTLRPGATRQDLFALEARLTRRVDVSLTTSLARHNGCDILHAGDEDLSIQRIIATIDQRMADVHVLSFVDPEEHDASVPAVSWHPAWVPIWTRGDGDLQALDLTSGRVLYVSHDGPAFRAVRASTYGAWLQQFLDDLREGGYRVSRGTLKTDLSVWPRQTL